MINQKIALSALSIVTALALTGGATFAFFSDTATSQDNTFSTGSADLLISQDNGSGTAPVSYVNDIPAPAINEAGLFPNFSKQYVFWLKNNSTSAVNLGLGTNFVDVVTTGNADIANQLNSQFTCVTDIDNDGTFTDPLATTGTQSVNAWAGSPIAMGTLGLNDSDSGSGADEAKCTMTVTLNNVDNSYTSSSVRFDGVFNGTQTP